MQILADLQSQARILSERTLDHHALFKDRVLHGYSVYVAQQLLAILTKEPTNLSQLQSFLKENWALVKKTALGYTAIPTAPVTHLLCDVAAYCAAEEPAVSSSGKLPSAIHYLMPDIHTEPAADATYVFMNVNTPLMAIPDLLKLTHYQDSLLKDEKGQFYDLNATTQTCETLSLTTAQETLLNAAFEDVGINDEKNKAEPVPAQSPLERTIIAITGHPPTLLYPDLETIPLKQVLTTHIINDSGQALLPIRLLTTMDWTSPHPLYNPYWDSTRGDDTNLLLNTSEKERLINHSTLTQAMNTAAEQLALLTNDTSHLLGHLQQLIRLLHFNSVENRGIEETAGEGAYGAIIDFNDYYEKLSEATKARIPPNVKNEIELLIQLSSDEKANNGDDGKPVFATCTNTRRYKLKADMAGEEATLSSIGIDGDTKTQLLMKAQGDFNQRLQAVIHALNKPETLDGGDTLGVNPGVLNTIGVPLSFQSMSDVRTLHTLSPAEIVLFMQNPDVVQQFKEQFSSLENWVMFCHEISLPRLAVLLQTPTLDLFLIHTIQDIQALLISMDNERFELLLKSVSSKIKTDNDLITLFNFSDPAQYPALISVLKERLPQLIKTDTQLREILQKLNEEQRTIVVDAMKDTLPSIIKSAIDFFEMLPYLTLEKRAAVCEAIKDTLPSIIKSGKDFSNALQFLTQEKRPLVCEAMKDTLPSIIKSAEDVGDVLYWLTQEQCVAVCDAMKDTLPNMLKSADDFDRALQSLTLEKRTLVFEAMKDTLPSIIKSADDVGLALLFLTPEQCTAVCEAMKETLPSIIKSGRDFGHVLQSLIPEQCTAVCKAIKNTLPNIIKSVDDFYRDDFAHAYVPQNQRRLVYETLEDKLPEMIKSIDDWREVILVFTPEQCMTFSKATRDQFLEITKGCLRTILSGQPEDKRIAVLDGLGLTFFEAMKTYSSIERKEIWALVPSERKHRLASLLPWTDTYSTRTLAIALMDNHPEQIKNQMRRLCQTKGDKAGYFRKKSIDALIDKLSQLDEFWIRRINTALDLHLSDADCTQHLSVKTALLHYAEPPSIPPTPPFTREGLITALTQYVEKIKMLQKAQSDATFAHFNVGMFKTRQHENRTANVLYAMEKLEQLKTKSVHDVFPNREQALKDRKRLMAGRSFHDHGIRSHDLNDILRYADTFIKINPQVANNVHGDTNENAQQISPP